MPKVKNTNIYIYDNNINPDDYLFGTDIVTGKNKNYKIRDLLEFIYGNSIATTTFASHNEACSVLGIGKLFRWAEDNIDGVPSPMGSNVGITTTNVVYNIKFKSVIADRLFFTENVRLEFPYTFMINGSSYTIQDDASYTETAEGIELFTQKIVDVINSINGIHIEYFEFESNSLYARPIFKINVDTSIIQILVIQKNIEDSNVLTFSFNNTNETATFTRLLGIYTINSYTNDKNDVPLESGEIVPYNRLDE